MYIFRLQSVGHEIDSEIQGGASSAWPQIVVFEKVTGTWLPAGIVGKMWVVK